MHFHKHLIHKYEWLRMKHQEIEMYPRQQTNPKQRRLEENTDKVQSGFKILSAYSEP